jgi:hypothetical protein
VHELGHNAFRLADDAPHIIPTLTIVDGTMVHGRVGVDAAIAQARAFAKKYL